MKARILAVRLALAALAVGGALFAAPTVAVLAQAGAEPDLAPTCTVKCPGGTCECYAESCVCACTWTMQPSCRPR